MTTEKKLQAVIEAQARGGCDSFAWLSTDMYVNGSSVEDEAITLHVLEILLDPAGLLAIWGNALTKFIKIGEIYIDEKGEYNGPTMQHYRYVASLILETWLASDGDAAQTIDLAYALLPKL